MVMATQNPVEYEGTFPLPEAQLDRFLLLVTLGYPTHEEELAIIEGQQISHPIDSLEPVTNAKEIIELQESVRQIFVDDLIKQYIVTVVDATRGHTDIALGASPRGSLALFRGSQALALMRDRDFVLPDDVKELTAPMLSHRIIVSAAARMRGIKSSEIINNIVNEIPVPGAQAADRVRR
jgi:MoxR-like ATPase